MTISNSLTLEQADEAAEWVQERIARQNLDELEVMAEFRRAVHRCPDHFTREQRELVHGLILKAYLRAIGRA